MKKLLLEGTLSLAFPCIMASCANDEWADVPTNEMKEVTLTTCLDISSRSLTAPEPEEMELFYTVYNATTGAVVAKNTPTPQTVTFAEDASVTLTLQLEQDQSYDIAFWAQPKGLQCYDLSDLKAIKVHYDRCLANDARRNAYYGRLLGLRASDNNHPTVSLKSPFGKLEVLTTADDVAAASTIGMSIDRMHSTIQVSGVADTFNALHGTVEGQTVTAKLCPGCIPGTACQIDGTDYQVLTSDYLLPYRQQTVEVQVELTHTDIERQPLNFTAGKAWLERGKVSSIANRFLTYPIEFDATVKDWIEG